MKPVLTSAAMRDADRVTIQDIGIPGRVLMESAGRATSSSILEWLGRNRPAEATILCGKGNNGGDGLVIARELAKTGFSVVVHMAMGSDALSPEAEANLKVIGELDDPLIRLESDADRLPQTGLLVDALLGTGQESAPRGRLVQLLERSRDWVGPRVAIDVPTGLNADSGATLGAVFAADLTVAIGALKVGHLVGQGPEVCGDIHTVEIGIPQALMAKEALKSGCGFLADDAFVRERYVRRQRDAHKYHSGPTLILGGSKAYPGAPALAATAAARVGSGYVVSGLPPGTSWNGPPEIPAFSQDDADALDGWLGRSRSVLVGPGLGRGASAERVTQVAWQSSAETLVVDADGLRALVNLDLLGSDRTRSGESPAAKPPILTPHGGEFAFMTGGADTDPNPIAAAQEWSRSWNAVLVMKGAPTIVAHPDGRAVVCSAGGPELATAGTGDVLAGMCTGLLAMGLPPFDAAVVATHLGGAASEDFKREQGGHSMMASDLVRRLPRLLTGRFGL